MKFQRSSLWLFVCAASVECFVPPGTTKPSFARLASPLDNLPQLPDVSQIQLPQVNVQLPKLSQPQLPWPPLPFSEETLNDVIQSLDENNLNEKLTASFQNILSKLQGGFPVPDTPQVQEALQKVAQECDAALTNFVASHPELEPLATSLQNQFQSLGVNVSPTVLAAVSALATFSVVSTLVSFGSDPPPASPYPTGKYDPIAAKAYFDANLPRVLLRGVEVAVTSLGFGLGILQDYVQDKLDKNSDKRAVELAELLTILGPSFIKVGQSLSIRTDLLSPAYVRGLQTLQDQVPPFSSVEAKQILIKEWGRPIDQVVSYISPEPVAAASLGQVYKATLKESGKEVAIKVQRPNIMEQIALDMHLLRQVAPVVKSVFNLNSDTVGTVDAWGAGFVDELDYLQEAENAEGFMESIQTTPLSDVVFAPPVVQELSTGKVLTTEWVDGERLDKSSNEDVTVLCSIAMNTYLTMMLETGTLHCDPHPGNLLRTPEGRLCILDWGMVTRLDKDLQLTLIEHMAHLTSADYAEIPRDLLLLDFIPQEKAHLIEDSGVVEVLADIYGAWTKGGGAATINVNKVVAQLQDLTATRGNLFQIPPYFAYIAKSFSVLEGIGLSNDPKYSIISECLPYVSKRLLTDQSERTGGALSTFIFGPDKSNVDTRIVDYDRVEQLVTGFGNYTTSASGALLGKDSMSRTEMLEQAADQIFDLILTEKETPLQTIFLEQLAKIVTASSRSIWEQLREQSGTLPSGRTVLGTLVDPLGFWRTSPLVRMNDQDLRTVHTTQKLISLMQTQIQEQQNPMFDVYNLSQEEALELSTILVRKVWKRRGGLLQTGNRFATQLLKLTADKLERGERDTIRLPEPAAVDNAVTTEADVPPAAVATTTVRAPSARLAGARKLLSEIESGKDAPIIAEKVASAEDPLRVKDE